jgi:hypothetical protein
MGFCYSLCLTLHGGRIPCQDNMIIRCRLCGRTQNREPHDIERMSAKGGFASIKEYKAAYLCLECRRHPGKESDACLRSSNVSPSSERTMTLGEVMEALPRVELIIDVPEAENDTDEGSGENTDKNAE